MYTGVLASLVCLAQQIPAPNLDGQTLRRMERPTKHASPSQPTSTAWNVEQRSGVRTPAYLKLEASWNLGPYCGPNSLYVLAQLVGNPVTHEEVCRLVPVREGGCSLEDLRIAAVVLGLDPVVRSITPEALHEIPTPFILHTSWNETESSTGHFLTVFGRNEAAGTYGVIDGTSGGYYFADAGALSRSISGYVLIPRAAHRWVDGMGYAVYTCALIVLLLAALLIVRQCRQRLGEPLRASDAK